MRVDKLSQKENTHIKQQAQAGPLRNAHVEGVPKRRSLRKKTQKESQRLRRRTGGDLGPQTKNRIFRKGRRG